MKHILMYCLLLMGYQVFSQENETSDLDSHYGITLNKGKKWEVPESMMMHITNIEKDLADFETKIPKEYQALAKKLDAQIQLLTASCTMKGKGHDELHKWLIPFIKHSNAFEMETDLYKLETEYQYLKKSIQVVNIYFL